MSEKIIQRVSKAPLTTPYGDFIAYAFLSSTDGVEHLALVKGEVAQKENVLVRVHSECITGDIFGSQRCDCRAQLQGALKMIAEEGSGAFIYLRGHEGRGIGLSRKLEAYALQDQGFDTVEANQELGLPVDARDYRAAAHILADLGIRSIRLLTNNPEKYRHLKESGVEIVQRIPLVFSTKENQGYLLAKRSKLGHQFDRETFTR